MWKLRIFANLPCYWLINIFWLCPVSVLVNRANIVFLLDRWGGHRKLGDFVSITSRTNDWAQESNLQILGSIACEEWCHLLLNQIDSVIWHNSMDTILGKRQNDIIITSFEIWLVLVTRIIIHGWNVQKQIVLVDMELGQITWVLKSSWSQNTCVSVYVCMCA